jgi:sigma-B regulation protein RsbU (phosphoserine phosphatase)
VKDKDFIKYQHQIIHDWSKTLTILAFSLVPIFILLDYIIMPDSLVKKFLVYRIIATIITLLQCIIIKHTKPGRLSYIHGYIVSLVVGGVIILMTTDLGGFSSNYYAGINLVIIGVNLLLPWSFIHSALNSLLLLFLYVIINFFAPNIIVAENMINNLFFISATIIIAVSINYVRYKLIQKEFHLRTELKLARDALWGEMQLAKKIQTSLLPENILQDDYEFSAKMIPADEVGGDYYDFLITNNNDKWLAIGDVSGHGVESGLIMMMVQTSITSMVFNNSSHMPSDIYSNVNAALRKNIQRLNIDRYMTALIMKIGKNSVTVTGKHHDIVVYRKEKNDIEIYSTNGTWLGISDNIKDHLEDLDIPISKGDMILLYTDGVTEADDGNNNLYGEERLYSTFKKNSDKGIEEIIETIISDVSKYQLEQDDDITVGILRKIS